MNIVIDTEYSCYLSTYLELPIEDWSEIKDWYVKWNTFHYTLDSKKWFEEELNCDNVDSIDWKRPDKTTIRDEDFVETFAEK